MIQTPDRMGTLFDVLTPRQAQVLAFRMEGLTQVEIAAELGIGQPIVCRCLKRIREKARRIWRDRA